ncbi:hypothetical protein V2W30_29245 [Streptomyces sp. Q6]|uniref:Uncharacterized protein n=1 Tax=Streptomyces citrinus TaxID=3118173 RepID=A0ACD5AIK6_9ACTN
MTGPAIACFALAAVVVAMACVRADWIRSLRRRTHPSGDELPTAAFVVARVLLLTMAALCVWQGAQLTAMDGDGEWSDDELTNAVTRSTDDLDGYWYRVSNLTGDTPSFDDYATLIEDTVIRYGGGGAPQSGVTATPTSADPSTDGDFTVEADGTDHAYCLHVERARYKKQDHTPPGLAGAESSDKYKQLAYRLTVTSRNGKC